MNKVLKNHRPAIPWTLIYLFLIILFFTTICGSYYYKYQKESFLSFGYLQTSVIADMKVRALGLLKDDLIADASCFSTDSYYLDEYFSLIRDSGDFKLNSNIRRKFKSLIESHDFNNAFIYNSKAEVVFSYYNSDPSISESIKPFIYDVIRNRKAVFTDFDYDINDSLLFINLLVPLVKKSNVDSTIFGVLVMSVDPRNVIFPMVNSLPLPSGNIDIAFINVNGEEVTYSKTEGYVKKTGVIYLKYKNLNKSILNFLNLSIPDFFIGKNSRGREVLASQRNVTGTKWSLVVKTDVDKLLVAMMGRKRMIFSVITLLILFTSSVFVLIWWNNTVRFYRRNYLDQLKKLSVIKHFEFILKFANDIILLFDSDLNIIEANDKAFSVYQYSREELIGMNVNQLRSCQSSLNIKKDVELIDMEGQANFETVHVRKDGSTFPVEISSRRIVSDDVAYYQSISRDITERKTSEEILRESEEKFRKVFEESPVSMVMTGKDFGIIKANSAFCNMTGFNEDELIGSVFDCYIHRDSANSDEVAFLKLISGELMAFRSEKKYVKKNGCEIWGSTTFSIIRNNSDEVLFFLVMIEDITARKKAEVDLIAAKNKAEENDRLKTAFLHNVSHEIRTPLNSIMGFSGLLNDPDVSKSELKQYAEIILRGSNQLISIINDIVDLASIESGQSKINLERINVNKTLHDLKEEFKYKQVLSPVRLFFIPLLPDREATLVTDNTKLIQVFSNLINNAFKFTKEGEIVFGYNKTDDHYEFFVRDTGIGISEQHKDLIFDRFYQVENTESKKYSGTGLGLSICKAYVGLLGGTMWLESEPGKGSEFKFSIPCNELVGVE